MRPSRLRRHPPVPPSLPADKGSRAVPQALRDFVSGEGRHLTLDPGPLPWMELSLGALPGVMFGNGTRPGTVRITVNLDVTATAVETVRVTLVAEVRHGRLRVDTSRVRMVPGFGDPRDAIEAWVKKFNTWLDYSKQRLGEMKLENGKLTVSKVE